MRLVVTRDDYFEAAMRILANEGAGELKISVLCKQLKVTSGSFYGYFGSFDGFVTAFLEYWEEQQTDRIVQLSNASPDVEQRVHLMKELAGTVPHEAEAAIRSWAHTNARVSEGQKRVDARRLTALTDVLLPLVGNRREARNLATMGITLLIGLQQWKKPVTKRDFNLIFNEYETLVLSRVHPDVAASG